MKIDKCSDYLLVYLNSYNLINIDDMNMLEKDIKKILEKLTKQYHIILKGNLKVDVLKDDYYGIILRIKEDNFSYDYFYDDSISLKIKIKSIEVLYQINDLYKKFNNVEVLKYKNNIYLKIKKKMENKDYFDLIENSKICINYEN